VGGKGRSMPGKRGGGGGPAAGLLTGLHTPTKKHTRQCKVKPRPGRKKAVEGLLGSPDLALCAIAPVAAPAAVDAVALPRKPPAVALTPRPLAPHASASTLPSRPPSWTPPPAPGALLPLPSEAAAHRGVSATKVRYTLLEP